MKRKIVTIIVSAFALWLLIHTVYITVDGLNDKNKNADVAIVFGNKVNEDGTLSQRLKERLNKSIELYNEQRVKSIIVSGGFGKEGFWEGDKMKEYLIANHIPVEKIIVDNFGNDTELTVRNSIRMMDSLNYQSAISVTQYFHQTRAKGLFKKYGFINIESVSPKYFEWRDFYSISREFVGYYIEMTTCKKE